MKTNNHERKQEACQLGINRETACSDPDIFVPDLKTYHFVGEIWCELGFCFCWWRRNANKQWLNLCSAWGSCNTSPVLVRHHKCERSFPSCDRQHRTQKIMFSSYLLNKWYCPLYQALLYIEQLWKYLNVHRGSLLHDALLNCKTESF